MRWVSTGLCLLSTPWWKDSLLVGVKQGKRKRKEHELFPEYLFNPSLDNLGFVAYTRLPCSTGGGLKPIISLRMCSFLGMAGVVHQQGGCPAKTLNSDLKGPSLWVQKKTYELCCPGSSGILPWAMNNTQ